MHWYLYSSASAEQQPDSRTDAAPNKAAVAHSEQQPNGCTHPRADNKPHGGTQFPAHDNSTGPKRSFGSLHRHKRQQLALGEELALGESSVPVESYVVRHRMRRRRDEQQRHGRAARRK